MTGKKDEPSKHIDAPMVDEVRIIRERIARQFDNDVLKLCQHLREQERHHPGPIVMPGQAKAKAD